MVATQEQIKEHHERCVALAALAVYNRTTRATGWDLRRPARGTYEFDIFEASGRPSGAMEVKSIVDPWLDKESALGRVIERLAERTSGNLPGKFQLLHVDLPSIPTAKKEQDVLIAGLESEIKAKAPGLGLKDSVWLDTPVKCILRKVDNAGNGLEPLYGFAPAASGLLDESPYIEIIKAGTRKANTQLAAAIPQPRLLVFDSRTPLTQATGSALIVKAMGQLKPIEYSQINHVFLADWPSNTLQSVAGLRVVGFPL